MKQNYQVLKGLVLTGLLSFTQISAQTNFAIINSDVKEKEVIINSLSDTKVFIADVTKNSGQIMNEIMSQNPSVEFKNLMIFGHGESGQFEIGSTKVNSQNLASSLYEFTILKNANKLENLFLYGCNVAAGKKGEDLINSISTNLKLNVKASKDLTGKGGNWDLEYGNAVNNTALNKKSLTKFNSSLQVVAAGSYTINNIPVLNNVQQIAVDNAGKRIMLTGPNTTGILDLFNISTGVTTTLSTVWASSVINCWHPYISTDVEYYNGYMYCYTACNTNSKDSIVKTSLVTGLSTIVTATAMPANLTGIENGAAFVGNKMFFTSPNSSNALFSFDMITKAITTYSVGIPTVSYHTLEYNAIDGNLYLSTGNSLYRVNLAVPSLTLIGTLNSANNSQFAIDPDGLHAWTQDGGNVYKMSLATGISTVIVNSLAGNSQADLEFGPSTGTCNANGASLYIGKGLTLLELKGFTNNNAVLSINTLTYCAGSTFKLPYLATGNFCAGNVFTAELSDAAGSFTSAVSIGTKTTTLGADTIMCTIPSTIAAGTGYKLRINSSNPASTGPQSAMTLTLYAIPSVSVATTNTAICIGATTTLTASGATTYSWNTASTNTIISVTPTVSTSYTVVGSNSTCSNTAVSSIIVNSLPTITVNSATICSGNSFTMNPSGASTYTFSNGSSVATPTANASYSVTGTSSVGCVSSNTAVSSVSVNPSPTVTAVSNLTLICSGETATLTANGAPNYSWNTSSTNTTIAVSPSVTTSYTVTGTDANNCSSSFVITQAVSACAGIQNYFASSSKVMIYPNPSNGLFTVELNNGSTKTIQVIDVTGRIVLSTTSSNDKVNLNMNTLANGVYYVKIQSNNSIEVVKIVKQ